MLSKREYTVGDIKNLKNIDSIENFNLRFIASNIHKIISHADNGIFEFYTSGSSHSERKCIKKVLQNFLAEAEDAQKALHLGENLEFITTTTPEHAFGFVFYFIFPLDKNSIINLERISYPEEIKVKNAILITTPSFLESLRKYNAEVEIKPKAIISAGSKLKDETYKYAETIAERVIDIYGSTETGTVGYRESSKESLIKLFNGIKILSQEDNGTKLSTIYTKENIQTIGDRVKLHGDKIELLGRCDRILKIQEKRILAEDIEEELKKSEFVEDCYNFEHDGKIAAAVILSEIGKNFIIEQGNIELVKRLKNELLQKFEVVPQRWKFIDEMPKNSRGKIDVEQIKTLFNINLSLPLVLSRKIAKESAEFELCFLKSSNFFRGHFDGMPILPGVVHFFYADFFIKEAFKTDCHCGQIRKVKFSNIIQPNKILKLKLNKTDSNISFKYEDNEKTYSSGIFPIQNYL